MAANAAPLKRHSIASGEMDFGPEDETDVEPATPSAGGTPLPGRMRSLSATLGDLFGSTQSPKRRRMGSREDGGAGGTEQAGRNDERGGDSAAP